MNLAREPSFRLGVIEVRPATREIVHPGGRETLEPRVMAVLVLLARAGGEVVTRDDLIAACWEGRVVSDDAINRVISRVRKLSELTGGQGFSLETITKVGYRLVPAPVGAAASAIPDRAPDPEPAPSTGPDPAQPARAGLLEKMRRYWLVAVGAVAAGLLGAWTFWGMNRAPDWSPDPTAPLTLAVLPFDNLGGSESDSAVAMGLAREIRNTLSRVRGLRVVSDSSSFAVASEPLTATDMGRRLKADLLLDGSVIRSGDSLKVTVELVDGWEGVNLWTDEQSGSAADLDGLRQGVSADVTEQLVLRLGPNRIGTLPTPRREDPKIYALAVRAWDLLEQVGVDRMRGKLDEAFEAGGQAKAIVDEIEAIDPQSPQGLLLKARLITTSATVDLFRQGRIDSARAAEAASYMRQALSRDPDLVPALAGLGEYYRRFEWRWQEARTLLERALALDPNDSSTHLSYAYYLSSAGRCVEALEHARIAMEIDPEFGWRSLGIPRTLKCLGRFKESDDAYFQAIEQDPSNVFIMREIYLNFLVRQDPDGLEKLRRHVRDTVWKGEPSPEVKGWLDWTGLAEAALRGDRAPFVAAIEREARNDLGAADVAGPVDLRRARGDVMWIQAIEFAFAGEPERSVKLLEGALESGSLYIPETMPYGAFEFTPEVRANPRYQAIWRTDPRLAELAQLRLEGLRNGQMQGVLPDGQLVTPPIPAVDSRS
ncbi:MAG: winged helix-turn-helix domain-containing protein [Hyphomonadaceae bacterium]